MSCELCKNSTSTSCNNCYRKFENRRIVLEELRDYFFNKAKDLQFDDSKIFLGFMYISIAKAIQEDFIDKKI